MSTAREVEARDDVDTAGLPEHWCVIPPRLTRPREGHARGRELARRLDEANLPVQIRVTSGCTQPRGMDMDSIRPG